MAKKNNTKGIKQFIEDNKWVILACLVLVTIATYLISSYFVERLSYKYPQRLVKNTQKKKTTLNVSGATKITKLPDGTFIYEGLHLKLLETEDVTNSSTDLSTPILRSTILLTCTWGLNLPMSPIPTDIGISYMVLRPVSVYAKYSLKYGEFGIGLGLGL